jgi:hypothetical protein
MDYHLSGKPVLRPGGLDLKTLADLSVLIDVLAGSAIVSPED